MFDGTVDIGAFESQTVVAPPSFVVDTTEDELVPGDGKTSLREAIAFARAYPGRTITFDPAVFASNGSATIQLIDDALHGTLELTTNVTIVGPGANALAVRGGKVETSYGVLLVDSGVVAVLSGLTIAAGNALYGGGITNFGQTTLTACAIAGNAGVTVGGISNDGVMTISDSTISDNDGGGIVSDGTMMLYNCTIAGNFAKILRRRYCDRSDDDVDELHDCWEPQLKQSRRGDPERQRRPGDSAQHDRRGESHGIRRIRQRQRHRPEGRRQDQPRLRSQSDRHGRRGRPA